MLPIIAGGLAVELLPLVLAPPPPAPPDRASCPQRPMAHSFSPSGGGKSGSTDPVHPPARPHSGLGERLTGLSLLI